MSDDSKDEEKGRASRFARWDSIGIEAIKADLQSGGHRYVGGTQKVKALAWEWVRIREVEAADAAREVVTLKPEFHGVSVDLKEAGRRAKAWWKRRTPSG